MWDVVVFSLNMKYHLEVFYRGPLNAIVLLPRLTPALFYSISIYFTW